VATIRRFEDIEAWQKARALTNRIYDLTAVGPFSRDFVLRDQIRRAAVSVMANIAEGFERGGDKEFGHFLAMAKGSCGEMRSHLHVALDRQYVTGEQHAEMCELAAEVSRMVSGLMKHLRQSPMRGSKYK